jgi:hypothetical protein
MLWNKWIIFRENKGPVLIIYCLWKAVINKVLRSVAAWLLKLLNDIRYISRDF